MTPPEHKTSAFMYIYLIAYNQNPPYNTNDFTASYWLTPQELIQIVEQGEQAKSDLIKMIKYISPYL
jgi:isopentenyl-diphosphate delta-isomerase